MTIVMGLDQHRAQITAEWLDTETLLPVTRTKFALRSTAQRVEALDQEITALDRELHQLVAAAAPRTVQLLGISTGHAGQLLVTVGPNIERLRSESSFSMLCGASPLPASSGKTTRHRLNYGGDRQANRALRLIAVCRLRYCERTRAYAKRRTAEGKPSATSSGASSATSHAKSSTPSVPTSRTPATTSDLHHHHVRQPRHGINRTRT